MQGYPLLPVSIPQGGIDPIVKQLSTLGGPAAQKLTFLQSKSSKVSLRYSISSCHFLFSASKTISAMGNEKQYIKPKTNDHKWPC